MMSRRAGPDASKNDPDRAFGTPEPDPSKRATRERIVNAIGSVWLLAVVGLVVVYQTIDSSSLRTLIVASIAMLILLGLVTWGAWALRFRTTVRKAIAMVFLVGVVMVSSLIPVIFLGTSDRILLLKLGAIAFLSLFPGLLYLQFVAVRAETLWTEYVLNLHRLRADTYDNLPRPPRGSLYWRPGDTRTRDDPENLYKQKFNAVYGVRLSEEGQSWIVPQSRGSLMSIGLCTVLLAVGWTLALQPEPISTDQILRSVTLSGRPILPVEALRFSFLGSYVFVVEILIRRYFQDDLKTDAYLTCAGRVLTAVLIVAAIHQVWPWGAGQEAAFAFAIGVFPMVGIRALQSFLSMPLRPLLPNLKKDYPLSELDGLNIWYESRLLEEGIEDMQNLATANIVDVMLRTRVPVNRLIDWVDQAILELKVKDAEGASDRAALRRLGIRTATDLEDALGPSTAPSWTREQSPIEPEGFLDGMRNALNDREGEQPSLTVSIWKTLAREPNLFHVRRWKEWSTQLEAAWASGASAVAPPRAQEPIVVGDPSEASR
jgi:hypothetical protein